MDRVVRSVSVGCAVSRVFRLWKNFELFPTFMKSVKDVKYRGGRITHWVIQGPLGYRVQWDAVATAIEENRLIAWRSIGGDIYTEGTAAFTEITDIRTYLTVTLAYEIDSRMRRIATRFYNPGKHLEADLERFRAFAERRG
jgi:uncharacterized membrane protein